MVKSLGAFFLLTVMLAGQSFAARPMKSSDKDLMEQARSHYSKGRLEKAMEIYTQIPASSDFWLEALEERAWAAVRQGDHEKALADLQSITSPVWSPQVGPETYMLSAFVSLKICAYKDVVKKIQIFKTRMLPRLDALQALIDQPAGEAFWSLAPEILAGRISMMSLGQTAEKFPRYFYRDKVLLSALESKNNLQAEARLKVLADQDLKEIETNLKKMKLIEVELIQDVLLAENLSQNKSGNLKFSKTDRNRQMVFPVTDEEVWVDEVGNFQVRADKCPGHQMSKRSLR